MAATGPSREDGIRYPFAEVPAFGGAMPIAPGVLWIRLPMPLGLDHVNVWAIEDGDGYTVVDTGLHTKATVALWPEIMETHLGGRPVRRVIVTHGHEDHVGMAGWLVKHCGAELWMTSAEYEFAKEVKENQSRNPSSAELDFYRAAGWDDTDIDDHCRAFGDSGSLIHPLPEHFHALEEAKVLKIGLHDWHIVTGSGHSPLHACLHCPELGLLISGDQVLPRISSNVSVLPSAPEDDPLARWMGSLGKLRDTIPSNTLVMPAHNACFYGLHARLAYLLHGHERTLEKLVHSLVEPRQVRHTFEVMFGRDIKGGVAFRLATGEALAHLQHLCRGGRAKCEIDAQGRRWYARHSVPEECLTTA